MKHYAGLLGMGYITTGLLGRLLRPSRSSIAINPTASATTIANITGTKNPLGGGAIVVFVLDEVVSSVVTPVRNVVCVVTVETTVLVDVIETTVGDAQSIVERASTIAPGKAND